MKVEVPKPGADRPELGRVGVIACVGFAIGIAWPWLAGVRLVPSPPTDDVVETALSPSASAVASAGPAVPAAALAASGAPPASPTRTREETVKVSDMKITVCRDGDGKKLKDCDRVGFDSVARSHLVALASCEAAAGAADTLSIGFELDFEKKTVSDVFAGKSTTFPKDKAHALVDCAKKEFENAHLEGLDHEHSRYTAFYFVEFVPPGTVVEAPGAAAEETAEASGLATIGWDVAVVRDQPEDGKILTRLRYGTRVVVTARRGKWYEVKYDAKGTKGWVHRNALGL